MSSIESLILLRIRRVHSYEIGIGGDYTRHKIGATSLMYACQQGKVDQVVAIINAKPEAIHERERTMKTALHYCAESGEDGAKSAASILDASPELVSAQDQDGYSALHLAVIAGNVPLATLLLNRGAPVNLCDNEGHTPAHWATVCGEIESLELVLSRGGDANKGDMHGGRPLHYAAQMCGPFSEMPADRRLGMTALNLLLHKGGADPNLPDNHGRPPMLWAASAGSSEALLVLVNAGARVAAGDKDGLTALHCAASRGHTDCVETLITFCSAETDVIDNNGCSALFYAVTLGHADATQALLNHGANPNRQDRKGRTAMHCGAAKGQLETVKVVGACGGNLWSRTARGDYPFHEAAGSGRIALVLWLLSLRPDSVNATNNDGRSPIHIAALHNSIDMAKTLLDNGSLVNPVMRTGKGTLSTPFDLAIHKGHRSFAKFLQLHGGVPASRLNSESAALRGTSKRPTSMTTAEGAQGAEGAGKSPSRINEGKAHNKNSAVSITTQKEITLTGRRPRMLQVYVEDDVMIRRIRPPNGSDSSIEERVRRRRRKRKSKLTASSQRNKDIGVRHESMSSEDSPLEKSQRSVSEQANDERSKSKLEEKLVQTEIAIQPDIIESHKDFVPKESEIITDKREDLEEGRVSGSEAIETPLGKIHELPNEADDMAVSPHSNLQVITAQVHNELEAFETDSLECDTRHSTDLEDEPETVKLNVDSPQGENELVDAQDHADTDDNIEQVPDEFSALGKSEGIEENKDEEIEPTGGGDDDALLLELGDTLNIDEECDSFQISDNEVSSAEKRTEVGVDGETETNGKVANEQIVPTEELEPSDVPHTDPVPEEAETEVPVEEIDIVKKEIQNAASSYHESEDIAQSVSEVPAIEKILDEIPPQTSADGLKSEEVISDENVELSKGLIKVLDDDESERNDEVPRKQPSRERKKWPLQSPNESFEVLKYPIEDEEVCDWVKSPLVTSRHPDSGIEPSPVQEKSPRSKSKERSRIPRACRMGHDSGKDSSMSVVSVTQAVQYSVRKYHLERRIFHQLLELKRLQIRAGRASEAVLVKRLVDDYKKAGLMLGIQQYTGVYTFRAFEKYLYEQLRLLQSCDRRMIPRLRSSDDLERLRSALRRTRGGEELLARPGMCTLRTHSCHHAAHAYTGIPCAAYITKRNHHTMPKSAPYSGFLPKIVNNETQGEMAKTLRYVDPSRPLKLELSHGPEKQVITLPTESLDKSKRYFVTFTIKSGEQPSQSLSKPDETKHIHGTTV